MMLQVRLTYVVSQPPSTVANASGWPTRVTVDLAAGISPLVHPVFASSLSSARKYASTLSGRT